MEQYRTPLTILAVGLAIGVVMFVIVWSLMTFNAGIAVGGTFWATGAFLGFSALRDGR